MAPREAIPEEELACEVEVAWNAKGTIFEHGYAAVANDVSRNPALKLQSIGLYAYIAGYAGKKGVAYPSLERILKETKVTYKTYKKYLQPLIDLGYVDVEQRRDAAGRMMRNVYILNVVAPAAGDVSSIGQGDMPPDRENVENPPEGEDELSTTGRQNLPSGGGNEEKHQVGTDGQILLSGDTGRKNFQSPVGNFHLPANIVKNNRAKNKTLPSLPYSGDGVVGNLGTGAGALEGSGAEAQPPESAAAREGKGNGLGNVNGDNGTPFYPPEFEQLLKATPKKVFDARLPETYAVWRQRVAEGYNPESIIAAFDAYCREYWKTHDTKQQMKQLGPWLAEGDGLAATAYRLGLAPANSQTAAVSASEPRNYAERRALNEAGTEGLAEALAAEDATYAALRCRAMEASVAYARSDPDDAAALHNARETAWARESAYFERNRKRARAMFLEKIRETPADVTAGRSKSTDIPW